MFSIEARSWGAVHAVRLRGELDTASASAVRAALENPPCSVLEVDLTELTFLDAAGLSAIVAGRERALRRGCRVRVVGAVGIVRRVFAITGLDHLLEG